MATVYENAGRLVQNEKFTLVKKVAKAGDKIPNHNHPEALVLFTVVKGSVKVFINEKEEFLLSPGKVLNFDGDNYISAEILEDAEIFVTLVLK